jgi:hypothetical protein
MYGVLGAASSRVPGTRPARPMPGNFPKRSLAGFKGRDRQTHCRGRVFVGDKLDFCLEVVEHFAKPSNARGAPSCLSDLGGVANSPRCASAIPFCISSICQAWSATYSRIAPAAENKRDLLWTWRVCRAGCKDSDQVAMSELLNPPWSAPHDYRGIRRMRETFQQHSRSIHFAAPVTLRLCLRVP